MFALFIHHLSKIADWQSKAQTFKFLTRERSKSYFASSMLLIVFPITITGQKINAVFPFIPSYTIPSCTLIKNSKICHIKYNEVKTTKCLQ